MGDHWFVIAVGFLAQAFFSARILVQWIVSERARRVLSPSIFWMLSLAGAYLLCLYGWMRNDFAIVLGQFVSYYIYIWNLKVKGIMRHLPSLMKVLLLATPVLLLVFVSGHAAELDRRFLHNSEIPLPLLLFGSAGQLIFTLRFVYQWYYSYRKGESHLPAGFWILSLGRGGGHRHLRHRATRHRADCRSVVRCRGLQPEPFPAVACQTRKRQGRHDWNGNTSHLKYNIT